MSRTSDLDGAAEALSCGVQWGSPELSVKKDPEGAF